jgi:hypothetical protein
VRLVQSIIAVPVAALLLTACHDDSNDGPSPSRDETASCLRAAGYQVETENFLQSQVDVVTPSDAGAAGRVGTVGLVVEGEQVSFDKAASVVLTFFASVDEAEMYAEMLRDLPALPGNIQEPESSVQPADIPGDVTTNGSVLVYWNIAPGPGEAETVTGCLQQATPAG